MKKTALLAIFLFLAVGFMLLTPSANAVDYYGGKILKRDKITSALSKLLRSVNPVAQLTIENNKPTGSQTIKVKETVFILGAVAGNCRPGKNILGLGQKVRGKKVITLGICK